MMEYKVENSGYNNTQEVLGFMHLEIEGVDDTVTIDVSEVTHSSGFDVYMQITFMNETEEERKLILDQIECKKRFDDDDDIYQIMDDELISDLFDEYGNNGGW